MRRKNRAELIIENLEIIEAGSEGVSLGKYEDRVVFVPCVVPGDVIDAQVIKRKKSFYQARAVNIHRYSANRADPPCTHFGVCGGCKWQNMLYETQLFYKRKQVIDNFQRIGKFDFSEVLPILPSEDIFAYRNKVEYTFSNKRWLQKEEMPDADAGRINTCGLGFHLQGMFDKVLDIQHCYLHDDLGNEIRNAVKEYAVEHAVSFWNTRSQEGLLRNLIIRNSTCGDVMLILVFTALVAETKALLTFIADKFPQITSLLYVINTKMNDSVADLQTHVFKGKDFMTEKMNDLTFKVSPLAFYQTNAKQALKLYEATARLADVKRSQTVYDLYTGTGTIALFVAKNARKVVGIEYVASAIENARENAALNNISNADFFVGDMAKIFTDSFIEENGKPDVIIADPPRMGMHPKVVEQILNISPERIVYVSCNPATQARDIALLTEKYKVTAVQPVDMFPHTHHVENIALLERIGNE
ncbi:MAG: 23S rRNA (uracil(1939)-C(5))-methyltransferase RlmD [Bacteroidales bacterium]|jgi:23S rRNA (uracil1939-C5)-methyltransferase|nr:23S rRNA (uracil(1939)-C(5))-methyltransferase RlmD [Bacteroidales bacterium]